MAHLIFCDVGFSGLKGRKNKAQHLSGAMPWVRDSQAPAL